MGESTAYLKHISELIFGNSVTNSGSTDHIRTDVNLVSLHSYVNQVLQSNVPESSVASNSPYYQNEDCFDYGDGRIGNRHVCFDMSATNGLLIVSKDKQSLSSQSNFSTIRANCGVYKGKWQYEVVLGSSGIMQLGWATIHSEFSQEIGVGDTADSYAFDGHRIRKWNVSTHKYGEAWQKDDTIGCFIDLEEGCIEFSRNGKSLGVAFNKIQMGSGVVYFPTVSLAFSESLMANFGSVQFNYPTPGFRPLQEVPHRELWQSAQLLDWFGKLLNIMDTAAPVQDVPSDSIPSSEASQFAIAHLLMSNLIPLLMDPYIIEAKHVPFLLSLCEPENLHAQGGLRPSARVAIQKNPVSVDKPRKLFTFLNLFLLFCEVHEFCSWVEYLSNCLVMKFRCNTTTLELTSQRNAMLLLNHLMKFKGLRNHFLKNVLFEKARLLWLMNVNLSDTVLQSLISKAYWETVRPDPSIEVNKRVFMAGVHKLKACVDGLEALQVEFLFTLLDNSDGSSTEPSSRRIFLNKFRIFLREQVAACRLQNTRNMNYISSISWFFFHRLLSALRTLWTQELEDRSPAVSTSMFYDGALCYHSLDRLGGVMTHLVKTLRSELAQHLPPNHVYLRESENSDHHELSAPQGSTDIGTSTRVASFGYLTSTSEDTDVVFPILARLLSQQGQAADLRVLVSNRMVMDTGVPASSQTVTNDNLGDAVDSETSLNELMDGLILLYHIAEHKEMKKVSAVGEIMEKYVKALHEVQDRINAFNTSPVKQSPDILKELKGSYTVLFQYISKWCSQVAWVRGVMFPNGKQRTLMWLFQGVLNTLQLSSNCGLLFKFTPDFYLDCLVELLLTASILVPPLAPQEDAEVEILMREAAKFIFDHISDVRIRTAKSKDTLLKALTTLMSSARLVHIVESVPVDSCRNMMLFLLQPYENRAWAHNNWVLVRMWQGSPNAFAFRSHQTPYHQSKLRPRLLQSLEFSLNFKCDPCPSPFLQDQLCKILLEEPEVSTAFLNSVLNQLNWAFSEFIGMLQEIQNISHRRNLVVIESRQLKTCATCFDLTLSLLRVLEMICTLALPVFVDPGRQNSDLLLSRLCQLLCQVLNRASSQVGCFHHVTTLEIPDLENVDHFPILTAVCGILLAILLEDMKHFTVADSTVPRVTKELLSEPSFQMDSLKFLMGGNPYFSLKNYADEVTPEEMSRVQAMLGMLDHYHRIIIESSTSATSTSDEEMCTICYALPISVAFDPCKHSSCRSCITHHLMNCRECFFCKAVITKVIDKNGKTLYEIQQHEVMPELS